MLVAYDANNVFRNGGELGEWSRSLVARLASRHVADYRALLFATRMKSVYKPEFISFANVSTYVPTGSAKMMPSTWMRFGIGAYLKGERVKVFHGLNEEIPYGVDVRTVVTFFGLEEHYKTSLMDNLFWKKRMRYAQESADVVVAVSEEVKSGLLAAGVKEDKVVVIGTNNPYEMTDAVADQYYEVYRRLADLEG